jgi:uncharacterized membrane protein
MALLSLGLGGLMVWLDARLGSEWLGGIAWYQMVKPEGAHEVLSTIAGSMITVAGVVFSITIVAIAYASSQFGPRVLTNFMADRGNKVTLGTFIATFTYCLVVLRTIRGGDEGSFVPQMAVLVGLLLAFCSIGVLIYFIHHVPQSIHINNVVAHIGRQLIRDVGKRFPTSIGEPASGDEEASNCARSAAPAFAAGGDAEIERIAADATGYLQKIDEDALLRVASERDLVLRVRYRPGDYVFAGRGLLEAWPAERVDEECALALRRAYSVGALRTPSGDLEFLINELVEIATRALSSGINDPTTASTCMDWLGAGATEIARRRLPDSLRVDDEGKVRVVALPDGFAEYVERAFGRLRQYAARDMNAALHLLRTLGEVAAGCCTHEQTTILAVEAERLAEMSESELSGAALSRVQERARALCRLVAGGPGTVDERQAEWLGGSA